MNLRDMHAYDRRSALVYRHDIIFPATEVHSRICISEPQVLSQPLLVNMECASSPDLLRQSHTEFLVSTMKIRPYAFLVQLSVHAEQTVCLWYYRSGILESNSLMLLQDDTPVPIAHSTNT